MITLKLKDWQGVMTLELPASQLRMARDYYSQAGYEVRVQRERNRRGRLTERQAHDLIRGREVTL